MLSKKQIRIMLFLKRREQNRLINAYMLNRFGLWSTGEFLTKIDVTSEVDTWKKYIKEKFELYQPYPCTTSDFDEMQTEHKATRNGLRR